MVIEKTKHEFKIKRNPQWRVVAYFKSGIAVSRLSYPSEEVARRRAYDMTIAIGTGKKIRDMKSGKIFSILDELQLMDVILDANT